MTLLDIFGNIDVSFWLLRGLFALAIIVIGVFLGKVLSIGLKKLSRQLELSKYIRGSFIDLFIVVIRWSVYILFLSLGLNYLRVPSITTFFTTILITIPAFVGALILLLLGFALAYYLKNIIKISEVKGWELVSQVIFYFILYIFGVYAIKTALISFDETTTNYLIIVLTGVVSAGAVYVLSKKALGKHNS